MNPEKIRIEIAKACGWRVRSFMKENYLCPPSQGENDPFDKTYIGWEAQVLGKVHFLYSTFDNYKHLVPPDYPNDLNAMHEAEKVLTDTQLRQFDKWLNSRKFTTALETYSWHATPYQRAEAFLRTLNKYEIS